MIGENSNSVPVTVEWARLGKKPGDTGYGVLACSQGVFDEKSFEQVLTRYSPGTLDLNELPQVAISWATQQGNQRYVGFAIYTRDESGEGDAGGREIMQTDYFCAPFAELSAGSVSYIAMHEQFFDLRRLITSNDPFLAHLNTAPSADRSATTDLWLAMRAAATLLTSSPVCVLGADHTNYDDRLRFIDLVASFLPYGLRSQLSASTWASSTFRSHKLRLFFTNAIRKNTDRVLRWNQPADGPIGHGFADEYLSLLQDGSLPLAALAEAIEPLGFDRRGILRALELSRSIASHRKPVARGREQARLGAPERKELTPPGPSAALVVAADGVETALESPPAAVRWELAADGRAISGSPPWANAAMPRDVGLYVQGGGASGAEDIGVITEALTSCSYALKNNDEEMLNRGITELRDHVRDRPEPIRTRLKLILVEYHLLEKNFFPDIKMLQDFYTVALRLAFDNPIKYQNYKNVEVAAGYSAGKRLHLPLARAMLRAPMEGAARLLLLNSLDGVEFKMAVDEFPIAPEDSVAMLLQPMDSVYLDIAARMAVRNLAAYSQVSDANRGRFRDAMDRNQLLRALQDRYAGNPDELYSLLEKLLGYAYGNSLTQDNAQYIFREVRAAPGEALLGVMLSMAKSPRDVSSIKRQYLLQRALYAGLSEDRLSALQDKVLSKNEPEPRSPKLGKPPSAGTFIDSGNGAWILVAGLVAVLAIVILVVIYIFAKGLQ